MRSALMAALKIEGNLPAEVKEYCHKALRRVSAEACAQAEPEGLEGTFGQLQTAILKKRIIKVFGVVWVG